MFGTAGSNIKLLLVNIVCFCTIYIVIVRCSLGFMCRYGISMINIVIIADIE